MVETMSSGDGDAGGTAEVTAELVGLPVAGSTHFRLD